MFPVFFILFNLTVSANNYFGNRTVSTDLHTPEKDLKAHFPATQLTCGRANSLKTKQIETCVGLSLLHSSKKKKKKLTDLQFILSFGDDLNQSSTQISNPFYNDNMNYIIKDMKELFSVHLSLTGVTIKNPTK